MGLEKSYIFEKYDIYYFGWFFKALQFSKHTNGIYKMNNNSMCGVLTNQKIFVSLWPGHDKGYLSYTPILLLEPKNFRGVLDFEDNLFGDKMFD